MKNMAHLDSSVSILNNKSQKSLLPIDLVPKFARLLISYDTKQNSYNPDFVEETSLRRNSRSSIEIPKQFMGFYSAGIKMHEKQRQKKNRIRGLVFMHRKEENRKTETCAKFF